MMKTVEQWRAGKFVALCYEVILMEHAKHKSHNTMEALASQSKTLCFQGQSGSANGKLFSSEGLLSSELHPMENEKHDLIGDCSSEAL